MPPSEPLLSSLILLPGIGRVTERRLWDDGIVTFHDFLARPRIRGIGPPRKRDLDGEAVRAIDAHRDADARFFGQRLPHGEAWRMFPRFARDAAFLDIETDGLSRYSTVTVVGIYRPTLGFTGLVRGQGLSAAAITQALEGAQLLVTFNGASFDLPFIRSSFPSARLPHAHLDLLTCARRLGWRGGLKVIERSLGLSRDLETRVLAGSDAVRLWRVWQRTGSDNAMRLLLKYNQADCENLEPVARASIEAMSRAVDLPSLHARRQLALPAA